MKINSFKSPNFGMRAEVGTKRLLLDLAKNDACYAEQIADKMNKIYVGDCLTTRIYDDGSVRMHISDKNGDGKVSVINDKDNLKADAGTQKIKNPEKFAEILYSRLCTLEENRSNNQVLNDKVNCMLHDGIIA